MSGFVVGLNADVAAFVGVDAEGILGARPVVADGAFGDVHFLGDRLIGNAIDKGQLQQRQPLGFNLQSVTHFGRRIE